MRRIVAALGLLGLLSGVAQAAPPYAGYIYDHRNQQIMTPVPYVPEFAFHHFGPAGGLKNPRHMVLDSQGQLWVADTGNNRVLVLRQDGRLVREIGEKEGPGALNEPSGLFVTPGGDLLVADSGNQRVVRFNAFGKFLKEYPRPESPLLGKDYTYSPIRVVEDRRGYLYVLNKGSSLGLMQIDPDGVFRGFFGANRVPFSWARVVKNLFATEEQKERLVDVKPAVYTDVLIDEAGFIYTVTAEATDNQVKKLSPVGVDVLNRPNELPPRLYGEFTFTQVWGWWRRLNPEFTALAVDKRGIITAVEGNTGRAYQYDQNRRMLFIFGGKGTQRGTFVHPTSVAVDNHDGTMYILDSQRNNIQVFRLTEFARLVHTAIELYNDGKYEEAVGPWQEVLRLNSRYALAHSGLGKALLRAEDYTGALREFYYARDRQGWSEAFGEWRRVLVRDHFAWVAWGFIMLALGAVWAVKRLLRWMRIPKPWEVNRAA